MYGVIVVFLDPRSVHVKFILYMYYKLNSRGWSETNFMYTTCPCAHNGATIYLLALVLLLLFNLNSDVIDFSFCTYDFANCLLTKIIAIINDNIVPVSKVSTKHFSYYIIG